MKPLRPELKRAIDKAEERIADEHAEWRDGEAHGEAVWELLDRAAKKVGDEKLASVLRRFGLEYLDDALNVPLMILIDIDELLRAEKDLDRV
jgi:hypothetical protein